MKLHHKYFQAADISEAIHEYFEVENPKCDL